MRSAGAKWWSSQRPECYDCLARAVARNLLDNAWRHASSAVAVAAVRVEATVELTIDDDGPGVPDAAIDDALHRGRRLDERGDGDGFGLPIARELADLNGGSPTLTRPPALAGLRVRLVLRAAA